MCSMEFWSKNWHSRLLVLLYLGLRLGFLSKTKLGEKLEVLAPAMSGASSQTAQEETTQKSKGDLQRLRDGCKNSLHLAAVVHASEVHLHRARMLLYIASSYRKYYQEWTHKLRDRDTALNFLVGLAHGQDILSSIYQTGQVYSDEVQLAQCGFIIEETKWDTRFKAMDESHPQVIMQDEKAEQLGLQPQKTCSSVLTWFFGGVVVKVAGPWSE